MAAPEFDWTFADAPDPDAPPGDTPSLKKTPRAPHRVPRLSPRQRRLLAAGVLVALLAGAGAWLFTRLGLRRLQAGLEAQIVYEDQRAQAGDAAAVLALQGPDDVNWRDEQAARARLGLAAPLPAGDLWPTTHPPRLAKLDPLGGDLFAATVSRDYTDLNGGTLTFDLLERYRNVSPGAWDRLPPDGDVLTATTPFDGQRVMATVPTVDLPWLGPALLQADDLIVNTCVDWGDACPPGLRLIATVGAPPELSHPALTAGERANNSPFIFYLPPDPEHCDRPCLLLAAPLLAGRPHDAAAQAALSHSLSVQLLGAFASQISGTSRAADDYFLDALVARAEVRRLGASAAPQTPRPQDYMPLAALWAIAGQQPAARNWRTDLPLRRDAFDFLNSALAGQPPSADGALLQTLRRGGGHGLDDWLAEALGAQAYPLVAAWDQQMLAAFTARAPADWSQYNALVLACDDGVYQVQQGSMQQRVWLNPTPETPPRPGSVSPDGRYLDYEYYSTIAADPAVTNSAPSPWVTLVVVDLATGRPALVFEAPAIQTSGWSTTDDLLYTVNTTRLNDSPPKPAVPLRAYHAATGDSTRLIPEPVVAWNQAPTVQWTADHTRLLLILAGPAPNELRDARLAVLSFGPPVSLRRLAAVADFAALAPDGGRVAYVKFPDPNGPATGDQWATNWLTILDVTHANTTTLSATNDPNLALDLITFSQPHWSADGKNVAWRASPMNGGDDLLTAPASGGPARVLAGDGQSTLFPVGFAPDGRYLAAGMSTDWPAHDQYWLFDQTAAGVPVPLTGLAESLAWAPSGHRLVIANSAGVSALDPASGAWEWLGGWPGCQVRW